MRTSRQTNGLAPLTPQNVDQMVIQTCTLRPHLKDAKQRSCPKPAEMLISNTIQQKWPSALEDAKAWKRLVMLERQRHGKVENILTR